MIKHIKIRDFKSIRELDLELGPLTVLIGRSGTGKSNVVQAIRFLRNLLIDSNAAPNYEGGWPRIVPVGEKQPKISIEVTFSLPGEEADYTYTVEHAAPPHQAFPGPIVLSGERLSRGADVLFSRIREPNRWRWDHPPAVVTPPDPADGLVIGMLPSLQKVVFAHAALSSGIGFYHFPSSTLNPAAPSAAGNDLLSRVPGLRDDAVNFRTVMQGIAQNFHQPNLRKSLLATLQAVNASIASVELDSISEPQRARAVVGHTANGRVFDLLLEQESDGLRRFYAHLLALYQTPSKLTMVFEEPENAIFPGALSVLADEFKAAPGEHRGQIILTTHSPTLLDAFDVDCVRAVEMREGRTVVGPVAEDQRASVKDHILTTGELLTADQPRAQTQ